MSDKEIGELSLKSKGVTFCLRPEWTIKDFLSYTPKDGCYSPNFSVPGSEWYISIIPNGDNDEDNEGWIGLYLYREKDSTYPKRADYSFGVKKADGTIEIKNDFSYVFPNDGGDYGTSKFLEISELERRKSELLPSGSLTITCTLRVSDCLDATRNLMKLSKDVEDMLSSERCSDATLKVKDKEFKIHKAVLESRSRVFESMFEIDMKEKETGVVEIVDCDPDVFQDFLIYLYSGKFENTTKRDFDLYRVADKYAVEELKSECVRSMISNLSIDNLFDVVRLGHEFGEKELELETQEFFNKNVSQIVPNDKWDSFLDEQSQLAKKLLKNMAMSMREQKSL